jgi:hypothetical protein
MSEYRPPRMTKKWVPKEWRPEYQRIVGYSACGISNIEIAQKLGFTKEHVSNILNLPEAKQLLAKITLKLAQNQDFNISTEMTQLVEQSFKRVKAVMNDDKLFEQSPFAIIDRGLEIMKGSGLLRGGGNGAPPSLVGGNISNVNLFNLPPELSERLVEGLEKSNRAREIHAPRELKTGTDGD